MKITAIQQNSNNQSLNAKSNTDVSFGRKKLPRYIYHFTRRYKYEHMLYDGCIKAKKSDAYIPQGAVFAVDLQNFFKNWGYNKAWNDKDFPAPLYQSLLDKVGSKSDVLSVWLYKFVILKIPTKILDKNKLRIRSQKTFFEHLLSDECKNISNMKVKKHLMGQTPATKSRIYNNRKEAIEYIYLDDIPLEKIEVLNDICPLFKPTVLDSTNEYLNVLKNLLKGTPQQNELKNFRIKD